MVLLFFNLTFSATSTELVNSQVLLFSSGRVRFYLSLKIEFICDMDLTYFPYDTQTCNIKFGSWHYTSEHINLTASEYRGTNTSRIKSAKDFQITTAEVKRNEETFRFIAPYHFIDVTYTIGLKRISSAYSTKLVLPSVLTGFLVLATFLLPTASYEKITLCSVLFLCLLVLIAFLHIMVPSTGETVLGQLLAFALCLDFFATIMAVVSYNVRSTGSSTQTGYGIMLEDKNYDGEEGEAKVAVPPSVSQVKISMELYAYNKIYEVKNEGPISNYTHHYYQTSYNLVLSSGRLPGY